MHVWLVKLEEQLPIDKDYRPYRMGMLADALVEKGHTVTRWCSDYNHTACKNRYGQRSSLQLAKNYHAELLYSGVRYRNPVSLLRLVDNFLLSRQFAKEGIATQNVPDLIVCSMPTPELAAVSAKISRHHKIPLVLDARDMWPDIIENELSGIKALLAKPIIWLMKRNLRNAATTAVSLVGITKFFRDHLLNYSKRTLSANDAVFPLGYNPDLTVLSHSEEMELTTYWQQRDIHIDKRYKFIYFAGRLNSTVFNAIQPVIKAASALQGLHKNIRFVLCGSGSKEDELRQMTASLDNFIMPGEVTTKALALLRKHTFAALLPIERRVDYQNSLSNKMFEYLSAGLPVLSWLDGIPGQTIKNHNCGFVYNNADELIEQIIELLTNDTLRADMSRNAKKLFDSEFCGDIVYSKFATHLEHIYQQSNSVA